MNDPVSTLFDFELTDNKNIETSIDDSLIIDRAPPGAIIGTAILLAFFYIFCTVMIMYYVKFEKGEQKTMEEKPWRRKYEQANNDEHIKFTTDHNQTQNDNKQLDNLHQDGFASYDGHSDSDSNGFDSDDKYL